MSNVYDITALSNFISMTGFEPQTTFWDDFSIAERFGFTIKDDKIVPVDVENGKRAIQDTYDRAFKEWKSNYKYITEFVMILNWKSWRYANVIDEYSELYVNLFYKAQQWCYDNLKGEELTYFLQTTD